MHYFRALKTSLVLLLGLSAAQITNAKCANELLNEDLKYFFNFVQHKLSQMPNLPDEAYVLADRILLPNNSFLDQARNFPYDETPSYFWLRPDMQFAEQSPDYRSDLANRILPVVLFDLIQHDKNDPRHALYYTAKLWSLEKIAYKFKGLLGPKELEVLPLEKGSHLNQLAFALKKLGITTLMNPKLYLQGNAALASRYKKKNGILFSEGRLYLPVTSGLYPNHMSAELMHEMVHATALATYLQHKSDVRLISVKSYTNSTHSHSIGQRPPIGIGVGQKVWKFPYINYGVEEIEGHYRQNLLRSETQVIMQALLMIEQILHLVHLYQTNGRVEVNFSKDYQTGVRTGILVFDFGTKMLILEFPLMDVPEKADDSFAREKLQEMVVNLKTYLIDRRQKLREQLQKTDSYSLSGLRLFYPE